MDLISVHNNWDKDVLNIDIILGNYCNYSCWYCWPGSNAGTHKFPDIDIIKTNITHLMNYYQQHGKTKFDIHFCGGEPTHWPQLSEFVKYLKSKFNCLISMTSNGSKKKEWWEVNAKYFDRIQLSCHHQYVDKEQFRNLCDFLYEANVVVSVSTMMDPKEWDKCISIVNYLKKSKHSWTIRYVEIIDKNVAYTDEQKQVLAQHRARKVNLWFFLKNNKYYRSKVTVIDSAGKKYRYKDNEILLKKLNNFFGWECSVGVNWINVSMSGEISGTCGENLFGLDYKFNLYDYDFISKFNPNITETICSKSFCNCEIETVMPKRKLKSRKIIPIYEH